MKMRPRFAAFPVQYDLLQDLEPLAMIASNPLMIVANASFPAKDLKELIGWLKANPGKASAGTAGSGSATHIGGIYFQNATGTRFELVPYKGTGPAMLDLVGGRIELMIDQASNSIPQVRGGKIRAYAITAKTRLAAAPDIPTVGEARLDVERNQAPPRRPEALARRGDPELSDSDSAVRRAVQSPVRAAG